MTLHGPAFVLALAIFIISAPLMAKQADDSRQFRVLTAASIY